MRRLPWDWLALIAVTLPLLALGWGRSSPMPWDEGYYALQARWMLERGDWWTPYWWETPMFDRSIGAQWLMTLSYRLFGYGNLQAHLPTLAAALTSVLLTYALGRRFLPRKTAWLSACCLALMPLWISYAHLATQDMLLLATELLGLYGLVRSPERSPLWAVLAGASLGLGFWFKGFMVVLPVLAVLPYVWVAKHNLLQRGAFWWGLLLGWVPTLVWLGISLQHWGPAVVSELWSKLLLLSKTTTWRQPWFFYLPNLLGNTFPFSLLVPPGLLLLHRWFRQSDAALQQGLWLLFGYPALLLLLLSSFNTKTHYYALQLLPFLAYPAAFSLWRVGTWSSGNPRVRWLGLAVAGLCLGVLFSFGQQQGFLNASRWMEPVLPNFNLTLYLGSGWLNLVSTPVQWGLILTGLLALSLSSVIHSQRGWRLAAALGMIWGSWLLAGQQGLLTNHAPSISQFLTQLKARGQVESTVDFQGEMQEASAQQQAILLALGAPHLGRRLAREETPTRLTWVSPAAAPVPNGFRAAAQLGQWQLIQPTDPG